MFMTTNRVSTFDEAFQSRIHMGIRYENLTVKARKEIWMHHVKKIEKLEDQKSETFKDQDFVELARRVMNGRQVCFPFEIFISGRLLIQFYRSRMPSSRLSPLLLRRRIPSLWHISSVFWTCRRNSKTTCVVDLVSRNR
jgi:hypothetical protein